MPRLTFASFVTAIALAIGSAEAAVQDPVAPVRQHPAIAATQPVREVPADRAAEWSRFVNRHPGTWHGDWNLATGTPRAVYGEGLSIADWRENTLDEARRHAHRVLKEESELLGLGTSDFRESIGARMGRTWSFTFDQYFRGLPVVGGRADVRVSMAGRIAMLGSVAFDIPADFATTPALTAEAATLLAWQNLGEAPTTNQQSEQVKAPRLVVWGDTLAAQRTTKHLAYEVSIANVAADGSGKLGRSYVDAQTGVVLQHVNDKHACGPACTHAAHGTGVGAEVAKDAAPAPTPVPVNTLLTFNGYTRAGLDANGPAVLLPMAGLQVTFPGLGTFTTNAVGAITVNLTTPVNVTISGLNGVHHQLIGGSSAPSLVFAAFPGLNQTYTLLTPTATTAQLAHTNCAYWIHSVNTWARGFLGNTTQLNNLDNIAVSVNVAGTCNAYSTGPSLNFYGAGGGCANAAFSTVIAHEWGHSLDYQYGGTFNTPTDGLSEGWGDTVAMYLVDDPDIGQGFQGSGSLRNGNNTIAYGTQTEVHAAGESWMGFAWRFRELLASSMTRSQARSISNDVFLGTIVANATNQIAATLEVFLADDDDGILNNGTPHFPQLQVAAAIHALPVPLLTALPNDFCAGALTIGNGVNGPYNNTLATAVSSSWTCSAGVADNDVWFRYTAPIAGQLTVSTCGLTSLNTKIQIRSGSCTGLVLACADNTCGNQTTCTATVPAGVVYVQVGAATFGNFSLRVWGPGTAVGVSHGTGCGPGPLALVGTPPRLGSTLTLTTTAMNAAAPIGLQLLGNVGYANGINLGPLGMPGCFQWSESLVLNTIVATGTTATYTLAIPNNTSLLDYPLTSQSAALAPGFNSFGMVLSNGWWMTVGN